MADDQPTRVSHWRLVREPALVTREIVTHDWKGEGTADDPYLIDFIPNDPRNPVSKLNSFDICFDDNRQLRPSSCEEHQNYSDTIPNQAT